VSTVPKTYLFLFADSKYALILHLTGPFLPHVTVSALANFLESTTMVDAEKIYNLSDSVLIESLSALVTGEREMLLDILFHFSAMDKRKLYATLGYSSMFAYATQKLKYAGSSAGRYISAARCIREFPEVAGLIEAGSVNLGTLTEAVKILNVANKEAVLSFIQNKTVEEVQAYVASFSPKAAPPKESIKPIVVKKAAVAGKLLLFGSGAKGHSQMGVKDNSQAEQELETRYELKFSIGSKAYLDLTEARRLLSGKYPA
jgi:hypothetical protein